MPTSRSSIPRHGGRSTLPSSAPGSRNCPFAGWEVRGRAHTVIVSGEVRYTPRRHRSASRIAGPDLTIRRHPISQAAARPLKSTEALSYISMSTVIKVPSCRRGLILMLWLIDGYNLMHAAGAITGREEPPNCFNAAPAVPERSG